MIKINRKNSSLMPYFQVTPLSGSCELQWVLCKYRIPKTCCKLSTGIVDCKSMRLWSWITSEKIQNCGTNLFSASSRSPLDDDGVKVDEVEAVSLCFTSILTSRNPALPETNSYNAILILDIWKPILQLGLDNWRGLTFNTAKHWLTLKMNCFFLKDLKRKKISVPRKKGDFPDFEESPPPPSKFEKTCFLFYWSFIANLWGGYR